MAIKIITDPTNYNKFYELILENVEYIVHVYWNNALAKRGFDNGGWYLSLYEAKTFDKQSLVSDNSTSLILGGVKLMPQTDVFATGYDDRMPTGVLICADTETERGYKDYNVGLGNFGNDKRFQLYYFTKTEYKLVANV